MVRRVLIAFDFDHTLIDETVDTYVLRLLPDGTRLPPSITKLESVHHWNDYQREVFRYLHSKHVTKDQLLSCVAEMPLVEGVCELLEYLAKFRLMPGKNESSVHEVEKHVIVNGVADAKAAENGILPMQQHQQNSVTSVTGAMSAAAESQFSGPSAMGPHSMVDWKNPSDFPVQFDVVIVSDANSAIIEHILKITGLRSMFSKVYTNPSSFDNSGCLQLSPYHRQDWCSISPANMCKGHILDEHCRNSNIKYDVIAFVGDGENDFCPTLRLRKTDVVFPRRDFPLDKHITEGRDKVAAMVRSWETAYDIMNAVKEVFMNVKA